MAAVNGQNSLEMKRQAVAYYSENKVPEHVEKLLNDMFKEKPEDIYGYMSEFFGDISKPPKISKITCHEVLSSRGYPTVQIDVYCTIKGLSKLISSVNVPYDVCPEPLCTKTPDPKAKSPDPGKQAKGQAAADSQPSAAPSETDIKSLKVDADDLIDRISTTLAPELIGADPMDPKGLDRILMSLVEEVISPLSRPVSIQENKEEDTTDKTADDAASGKFSNISKKSLSKKPSMDKKGAKETVPQIPDMVEDIANIDYAILGVSMATLHAGATLKSYPLFDYLYPKEDCNFTMPIPAMTLVTSGKHAAGKQNLIKEVLVLPKPGISMDKGLQQLTEIFHKMGTVLAQKINPTAKCVTEDGTYSPAFDKPEMLLDYVVEAINGCGYALGADVDIMLNCAASDMYDKDKLKYEIMLNALKTLDDVINMYADFLERYPGIIGIIDGVRSQDKEGWIKLNQRLGEKCFIIGDELYKRNSKLLSTGVTDKLSSGVMISADQANTITELLEKILDIKDQNGLVFVNQAAVRDTCSLVADIAVANEARFIKLGGPTRLENITKYRRLVRIEKELQQDGRILTQEPHEFPIINVQEETEEQEGQETTS